MKHGGERQGEPRIGLEIHVQLATRSKIFCGCPVAFGREPNANVCPICLGHPGTLPALNGAALSMAYRVAMALGCEPARRPRFARKNYFYPDLAKNYQISQFGTPVGTAGHLRFHTHGEEARGQHAQGTRSRERHAQGNGSQRQHGHGRLRRVRVRECHLEEDAGKMIHAGDISLLDYNRAGVPLLEIVTEPDLRRGEEAESLLHALRRTVRYLGVSDANMEEGSLRCDANVSLTGPNGELGAKVEIKNLNSSRFVRHALDYEIERQRDVVERGGEVAVETRLWNENRDQSEPMRTKEAAQDYRYFPEPDLPVIEVDGAFLRGVAAELVELPVDRIERLMAQYGLEQSAAELICRERTDADWFEECVAAGADPAQAATWLGSEVRKQLNRRGLSLARCPLTPERCASLLSLVAAGRIHGRIAKQALEAIFDEDRDPEEIVADRGWEQITDPGELRTLAREVLAAHPDAAGQLRRGAAKPLDFLIGRAMQASGGRPHPEALRALLREEAGGPAAGRSGGKAAGAMARDGAGDAGQGRGGLDGRAGQTGRAAGDASQRRAGETPVQAAEQPAQTGRADEKAAGDEAGHATGDAAQERTEKRKEGT